MFQPGHEKVGGRKKGTPNKATAAFKAFVESVALNPTAQAAVIAAIEAGRVDSYFRAAEHAFGKPKQRVEATVTAGYSIPEGDDVAEED